MTSNNRMLRCFLMAVILSMCVSFSCGFVCHRFPVQKRPTSKRWFSRRTMTMYVPPNTPISQTPPMVGQKILAASQQTKPNNVKDVRSSSAAPLSNSVLASCDTLPRFPTAHGLLSPETIQRLDEMIPTQERSEEVTIFLDTYHVHGPMACLTFLADPNVLPHLTEAMRDIA